VELCLAALLFMQARNSCGWWKPFARVPHKTMLPDTPWFLTLCKYNTLRESSHIDTGELRL
jgi:hypothetical protein